MTDYLDRFTAIEQDETGGLFVWGDYTIYWNAVLGEGELYCANACLATGLTLEGLADYAAEHSAEVQS